MHISGPNYKTPSESVFLQSIGADAIGMSISPEVTVARHADIRVLGKTPPLLCYNVVYIESTTSWFPKRKTFVNIIPLDCEGVL